LVKWRPDYEKGFHRFVKKLGSDEYNQFEELVRQLIDSEDPRKFGKYYKKTKYFEDCLVARLNKSDRLAYNVDLSIIFY
jgi:mRNA-degrading endonuclease RelE of RelBE toxin-antitoxin system